MNFDSYTKNVHIQMCDKTTKCGKKKYAYNDINMV